MLMASAQPLPSRKELSTFKVNDVWIDVSRNVSIANL